MDEVFVFNLKIGRNQLKIEFDFHDDYSGTYDILPKDLSAELEEFDLQLFEAYQKYSLCPAWDDYKMEWAFDNTGIEFSQVFMTREQHEQFIDKLNTEYIPKYDEIKNKIIGNYDKMKANVISMLEESFKDVPIKIKRRVPSKAKVEKSFQLFIPAKPIKVDLTLNVAIRDEIEKKLSAIK